MARTTATPATEPERKKRKRAAIIKFSFAGAALLGIGAAATSAAWTDDAWFSAAATTPTIQLQGGNGAAPTTWTNADTSATAVVIPASAFQNLEPGVARSVQIGLKNISTVPLIVAAPTVTTSGTIFTVKPGRRLGDRRTGHPDGAHRHGDGHRHVTPPQAWNGSLAYQNATGSITLQFTGSSS